MVFHWVPLICHKSNDNLKFYFLDPTNVPFLDKNDEQIPDVLEELNRLDLSIGIQLEEDNYSIT